MLTPFLVKTLTIKVKTIVVHFLGSAEQLFWNFFQFLNVVLFLSIKSVLGARPSCPAAQLNIGSLGHLP